MFPSHDPRGATLPTTTDIIINGQNMATLNKISPSGGFIRYHLSSTTVADEILARVYSFNGQTETQLTGLTQ